MQTHTDLEQSPVRGVGAEANVRHCCDRCGDPLELLQRESCDRCELVIMGQPPLTQDEMDGIGV